MKEKVHDHLDWLGGPTCNYYLPYTYLRDIQLQKDVVPGAGLEPFRPLKSSILEDFRTLKPYYQIGAF